MIESYSLSQVNRIPGYLDKVKVYLENILGVKAITYHSSIDKLQSNLRVATDEKSFRFFQSKIIEFLNNRIEECEIEISQRRQIEESKNKGQKIVQHVLVDKYHELKPAYDKLVTDYNALKKSKRLWNRLNWGTWLTLIGLAMSGVSWLTYHFTNNRYDKEKIQLERNNDELRRELESSQTYLEDSIKVLNTKIEELKRTERPNHF